MNRSRDKNFQHIREAYGSFRKKNYTNTIIILDQLKGYGVEDQYALLLQAVSYLYSNNFPAANAIIEKIQRLNPSYIPFIQLKAFLALKSAPTKEGAIAAYFQAIEKNPSDRLLRKGLRMMEDTGDFQMLQRSVKLTDLVQIPAPGSGDGLFRIFGSKRGAGPVRRGQSHFKIKPVYAAVISAMIVIAAAVVIYFIKYGPGRNSGGGVHAALDRESLNRIDMVDLSGSGYGILNRINREKTPEFYASGDELVRDFNEAKRLVKQGHMNRAVLILNRIYNSNASFPVKEKCDFLIRFIMESDQRAYEEIDLKRINEKPYMFRGSAVRFTGTVANIKELKEGRAFSLMVGYDGKNFKGICEVYDKGKEPVANGDTVEVRGMFVLNIGKAGTPYISSEKLKVY